MSMKFETFKALVDDAILGATFGEVDYIDLPNTVDLYEAWESDSTPEATARECLKQAGWEY
jgi:hypothetical protein